MRSTDTTSADLTPDISLSGMRAGANATVPLLPAFVAFGAAFGTLAAQKGLSLLDTLLMTGTVYAGLSQFIALQTWPEHLGVSELAALALVTATVNLRFVLMGMALQPWFGLLPAWKSYPPLVLITDVNWLMTLRYRAQGGNDVGFYLGSALLGYVVWVSAAVPGYMLAAALADPRRFGIDMIMPAFFAAMLVPVWRGTRRALAWVVAGAVALLVSWLVPGWWFIIAGAIAGSVTGGLVDEADEPAR